MPEANKYLNLGCGSWYHPDWINIDIAPQGPEIIQNDLSRGIPLPDASCVLSSTMRRCLDICDVQMRRHSWLSAIGCWSLVESCAWACPICKKIYQLYLTRLTAALNGEKTAAHEYDWIILELFDQIAREKGGSGMLGYLRQDPLLNETFVYERIGEEGRDW